MSIDENIWISHLYSAITKNVDIPERSVYNTEGSINVGNGLKIQVYSNDHGTHFHVKYQGEIDARFSYPDIELEGYVSNKEFTRRQQRNIINTLNGHPQFSAFIERELAKRSA